jgi:hypothetical protein
MLSASAADSDCFSCCLCGFEGKPECTGRASAPRFEQRERSGKTRLYSRYAGLRPGFALRRSVITDTTVITASAPFSTIYLSEYRIDGMYSSTYKYRSVHDFYCLGPDGANTIEHRTKSLQGVRSDLTALSCFVSPYSKL